MYRKKDFFKILGIVLLGLLSAGIYNGIFAEDSRDKRILEESKVMADSLSSKASQWKLITEKAEENKPNSEEIKEKIKKDEPPVEEKSENTGEDKSNSEDIPEKTEELGSKSEEAKADLRVMNESDQVQPSTEEPKRIAFTFDDGPNVGTSERILDAFKGQDGSATFFVVASRISGREYIVQRALEEGHELGNHSFNHPNLTELGVEGFLEEINSGQEEIYAATGVYPQILRPTYGSVNDEMKANVPMPMVNWNLDTHDWSSKDAEAIAEIILEEARDGSIVLMHDIYPESADAIELVLPKLAEKGFVFLSISELFESAGIQLQAGGLYKDINIVED